MNIESQFFIARVYCNYTGDNAAGKRFGASNQVANTGYNCRRQLSIDARRCAIDYPYTPQPT